MRIPKSERTDDPPITQPVQTPALKYKMVLQGKCVKVFFIKGLPFAKLMAVSVSRDKDLGFLPSFWKI